MKDIKSLPQFRIRVIVGIIVMLFIAAVHAFRIGSYLNGNLYFLYYSYASDIMLPFGAYFLLVINEIQFRFLRKWYVKFIIIFGVMTFSEVMQLFGFYFFGVTFDFLDILIYFIGALLAAGFERQVLNRFLLLWDYNSADE